MEFKKRLSITAISALILVLVFVQSTYAAAALSTSVSVSLNSTTHSATSGSLYVTAGFTISFNGSSSTSSKHQVALVLMDSSGTALDTVILSPGSSSGDTYSVSTGGFYKIGLGCGGTSQVGCTASATLSLF